MTLILIPIRFIAVKSMRIWVISELYYPELTSTGYFVTGIAEGLAKGYKVTAICGKPNYNWKGTETASSQVHSGVRIFRCPATRLPKDVLINRLLNAITLTVSMLVRALFCFRKGDCAIVVTNPPLMPLLVSIICKLRSTRMILLVHDVYPEILVATGVAKDGNRLTRIVEISNRLIMQLASLVVVLGRDMQELLAHKYPNSRSKLRIIPNWGDVFEIQPTPKVRTKLSASQGLGASFVVQHSGNMGRTHALEDITSAAELLLDRNVDVIFLMIGSGAKKEWLAKTKVRLGLSNVRILGYLDRAEIADSLNACDIAIIGFIEGMCGLSVPSRMYNVMAAGKPILGIASKGSELALVIEEERIGWVIAPGRPHELVETVLEAKANPELLAQMGHRARSAAEAKYTKGNVIAQFNYLIAELSLEDGSSP